MLLINLVRAALITAWVVTFLFCVPTHPFLTILFGWLTLAGVMTLGDLAEVKLIKLFEG